MRRVNRELERLVSRSFLPEPLHASIVEKMMLHGSSYASMVEEVIVPMNPGDKFSEHFTGIRKMHFSNPNAWYFNTIRTGQFPKLKKVTFQESKAISVAIVGRKAKEETSLETMVNHPTKITPINGSTSPIFSSHSQEETTEGAKKKVVGPMVEVRLESGVLALPPQTKSEEPTHGDHQSSSSSSSPIKSIQDEESHEQGQGSIGLSLEPPGGKHSQSHDSNLPPPSITTEPSSTPHASPSPQSHPPASNSLSPTSISLAEDDLDEQVRKAKQSQKSTRVNQAQLAFAESQAAGTQKIVIMERPVVNPSVGAVFAQEIEDIVIYGSGDEESSVERPILESLLENLPNLRSLEIWSARQHPEVFVKFHGPKLRRLRLFGGLMSSSVSFVLHHVLTSCPELEELEITSRAMVGWNDADNFDLASRLLIVHPHLAKLRLAHSFAKPVKFLLPRLTRLVLEGPQRNFISVGKSPLLQKLSIQATPAVLANLFLRSPACLTSASIVLIPGMAPPEADSSILKLRGPYSDTPPVLALSPSGLILPPPTGSLVPKGGLRSSADDINVTISSSTTKSVSSSNSTDEHRQSVKFNPSGTSAIDFDSGDSSGEGSSSEKEVTMNSPSKKSNRHRSVPRHVHRASLGAHLQKLTRAIDNPSKRSSSMVFGSKETPSNDQTLPYTLSPLQEHEITLRIESSSIKKLDIRIQTDKRSWPRLREVQIVTPSLDSLTLQLLPSLECAVPLDLRCPQLVTLSTCLHPSVIHEVLPEPEIRFPQLRNFYLTLQDQDVLPIVPILKNLSQWIFDNLIEVGLSNISILTNGLKMDGKKLRSLVLENLHTVPLFLLENLEEHLPVLEHLELKAPETENEKSSSSGHEDDEEDEEEDHGGLGRRRSSDHKSSTARGRRGSRLTESVDEEDETLSPRSAANVNSHHPAAVGDGSNDDQRDENPYYMQEEYRRMCPQERIVLKSKTLSSFVCTLELSHHPEILCPNLRHLVYLQQECTVDLNVHSIFRACPKLEKAYLGAASLTSCHFSAPALLRLKCVFGFVQPTWSLNTPLLERLKILRIRETPYPLRLTLTHATCPNLKRVTLCGVSLDSYSYNRLPQTTLVEELLISSKLDD